MLIESLFAISQFDTLLISVSRACSSVMISLLASKAFVSSANKKEIENIRTLSNVIDKNIKKNRGPKILPWGTPHVTICDTEETELNSTYCLRLLK